MNKYIRKPETIEAMRVGFDKWKSIAKWCKSKVYYEKHKPTDIVLAFINVNYYVPIGDWIIKKETGEFDVLSDSNFKKLYEKV